MHCDRAVNSHDYKCSDMFSVTLVTADCNHANNHVSAPPFGAHKLLHSTGLQLCHMATGGQSANIKSMT